MTSRLSEGVLSIFGSKFISVIIGFVVTPLLARILGSGLYGDYAFLMSLFGIGIIFVNAGTFDGLRKFVSVNKSRAWNTKILSFYIAVSLTLSVGFGALFSLFLATGVVATRFGMQFETYFILLAGLIVWRLFFSIARGTLMGFRLERYSETLHIFRRGLFAIGGVGLAYYGLNVTGVLLGDLLATATITVVGFVLVLKRIDMSSLRLFHLDRSLATELLGFNSLNVVLILLTASLYHTDIILLHLFVGAQATGYYKAALIVAEFLWFIPTVLQMALLQSTSELWDRGETEAISDLSSRITRFNYLFTQLLAVGIAVLAGPFVWVYFGREFLQAAPIVPILLVGALAFAISRPIYAIGQSHGSLRPLIAATGIAAGVNFVLNLVLIPLFGIQGAAVATAIGYGLMVFSHTVAARRIGFDPLRDLRLGRGIAVAGGTGLVLLVMSGIITQPLIKLAVLPPVGFVVYILLSIGVGALRIDELIELRSSVPI